MATIELRRDRAGNVISVRARIRRKTVGTVEKTIDVHGPRQTDINAAKRLAEQWARMVESEMDRGVFVSRAEAEATTLAEALDRYAREVTARKKGAARELARVKRWQDHKLARRPLASLRGADFATFRDERRAAGCAENTIRLELALLSHLFKIARTEWGMESLANPINNIQMPGGSNERERRLLAGEEALLLAALAQRRNRNVKEAAEFALATAMRQGEILRLTRQDVDLERSVAILRETKNGETRRVPLSPAALRILSAKPRDAGPIFKITQDGLIRAFSKAVVAARVTYLESCEKEGIAPDPRMLVDLKFHDLRHEATSRLFESQASLNVMEVASITGHKTIQMLKRYTHLNAEALAARLAEQDTRSA